MRRYSREALTEAFRLAADASRTFPPSAPAICGLAEKEEQRLAALRRVPPTAVSLPEPCELKDGNPFLELARKWEFESLEIGLDPERVTPKQIAERRMSELMGLLDKHGPQDMPSEQESRRVRRGVAA